MALPDIDTALDWRGRTVVDHAGEKIGKLDELYLDEETSRPEWASVTTSLLGRRRTLVPLAEARPAGDDVQVPFGKEQVEKAPSIDLDDELSQDEEARLYRHYGIQYSSAGTVLPEGFETGTGEASARVREDETGEGEQPASEPGRDRRVTDRGEQSASEAGADGGVTDAAGQSQELRVGTEVRPRERVRLKKYVVTEEVTRKVPVSREEVRLEREPVEGTEPEAGAQGGASEEEEVVLKEEKPVFGAGDKDR
jgi:hypothetical protein